jgi:small GTP-binding protein
MSDAFLYDVFLSHSPKDKEAARGIAERLRAAKLRVWFDGPGTIEEGLERSRAQVLCLSANAFGSDWEQLENQTFRFRDPLNTGCRFVPLRLDDAPANNSLAQFVAIDWRAEPEKLVEACRPPKTEQRAAAERLEEKVVRLASDIYCVAFSPDGKHALSGSVDNTVRLWEVGTGRAVRVLEGHSASVYSVAFSPDGKHALSGSFDQTVRLWDLESDGPASAPEPQVQYTNAKVLLVGDSGVGKSGLAERLVHKRFIPTKSSHARKAHVLENQTITDSGGGPLQRETMLWDLAGQPAYRLVHQLSMEDAVLACVLFDSRSETNPFEGAAYWSNVLDQARTNTKLKKLLVASRIDVGGLPAGKERIESFARENNFARFIPTSAFTGEGCHELLEAIRQGIPWDEVPKVTTTTQLAALRDYVARLKGENNGRHASPTRLFTVAQLHEGFAAYSGEKIPLAGFISHLERLEATDAVDLLVFHTTGAEPRPDHLVLLNPTRVDAYASALLVAAKDEPDGPGHLLESRVREGKFKLDAEERIADPDSERHVLWHVMESLLARAWRSAKGSRAKTTWCFPRNAPPSCASPERLRSEWRSALPARCAASTPRSSPNWLTTRDSGSASSFRTPPLTAPRAPASASSACATKGAAKENSTCCSRRKRRRRSDRVSWNSCASTWNRGARRGALRSGTRTNAWPAPILSKTAW